MDEIIKRVSERLVDQSSRRGFFSTMSKVVLAAGAVLTGQSFFAQHAEAASIKCCTGTPCSTTGGCPSGTKAGYNWFCGGHFGCQDCFNSTTGHYSCTYVYSTR